ncbi:MAG: MerR family transcriptional regulator [Methylococcales bacterium]|nr:MerR family transcriptional regulator [Methylococcales bacterium]
MAQFIMQIKAIKLTIGKLAKKANINIETIRFYQQRGLISIPDKPSSGYRTYSDETLSKLLFIKQAKCLGFTLTEIQALLKLDDGAHCSEAKLLAEQKLTIVKAKLDDLRQIKTTLENFIDQCPETDEINNCPLIQALKKPLDSVV